MSEPNDDVNEILDENTRLKQENEKLSSQVNSFKKSRANRWDMRFWAGKKIGEVFLGWRLSGSVKQLVKELGEGKVRNETLGNVLTHILWRFTRIGIFAVLLAVIPSAILIVQTKLLSNQNKLLDIQNERVNQQNHLIEAQRRSSYVFLLGNIMDYINDELKDPINATRTLSPQLVGQIIAISHSLTPYKWMDEGNITESFLSPERGMLLIFLLESDINKIILNKIFLDGNFKNSYAQSLSIRNDTLDKLELWGSKFSKITMKNTTVKSFDCSFCILDGIEFNNSIVSQTHLYLLDSLLTIKSVRSKINNLIAKGTYIHSINFDSAIINKAVFQFDVVNTLFSQRSVINNLKVYTNLMSSIETISSNLKDIKISIKNKKVTPPFPALISGNWRNRPKLTAIESNYSNLECSLNIFDAYINNSSLTSNKPINDTTKFNHIYIESITDSAIDEYYLDSYLISKNEVIQIGNNRMVIFPTRTGYTDINKWQSIIDSNNF